MGEKYRMSLLLVAGMMTVLVLLVVLMRACFRSSGGEEGPEAALLSAQSAGALSSSSPTLPREVPGGEAPETEERAGMPRTSEAIRATRMPAESPAESTAERAAEGTGPVNGAPRFRRDLTEAVFALLAIEYTNNTNPDSPHCVLTPESLRRLDEICERWESGQISDEQAKVQLELLTLDSGRSPAQLPVYMKYTSVKRYQLEETEPAAVSERLMQLNIYPRHYLYLRIYDAAEGGCLVYMVNGLIW